MFQLMEYVKTREEEAEINNIPSKSSNNDHKDDLKSQKKNGGTDQEDTRNV